MSAERTDLDRFTSALNVIGIPVPAAVAYVQETKRILTDITRADPDTGIVTRFRAGLISNADLADEIHKEANAVRSIPAARSDASDCLAYIDERARPAIRETLEEVFGATKPRFAEAVDIWRSVYIDVGDNIDGSMESAAPVLAARYRDWKHADACVGAVNKLVLLAGSLKVAPHDGAVWYLPDATADDMERAREATSRGSHGTVWRLIVAGFDVALNSPSEVNAIIAAADAEHAARKNATDQQRRREQDAAKARLAQERAAGRVA